MWGSPLRPGLRSEVKRASYSAATPPPVEIHGWGRSCLLCPGPGLRARGLSPSVSPRPLSGNSTTGCGSEDGCQGLPGGRGLLGPALSDHSLDLREHFLFYLPGLFLHSNGKIVSRPAASGLYNSQGKETYRMVPMSPRKKQRPRARDIQEKGKHCPLPETPMHPATHSGSGIPCGHG